MGFCWSLSLIREKQNTKKPVDHVVVILALTSTSNSSDRYHCPVLSCQTLRITENLARLFLLMVKEQKDFKADTLTHWIRQLIILTCKDCPTEELNFLRVFHEVQGIATLWVLLKNISMTSLLRAG